MYAGKIRLVSTEQGVGVNNAGQIYASAGNVEITANGLVANSGKIAASDTVAVSAQALQNAGAMYAQNRANIAMQNGVQNSGAFIPRTGPASRLRALWITPAWSPPAAPWTSTPGP